MYAGVDIGGTKTLVAALNDQGVIVEQIKFATPRQYPDFVSELEKAAGSLKEKEFRAACVAVPGRIDRLAGIGENFGNLPWHHVPIQADAEKIFDCPTLIENDAKLAALSESMLLPKDKRILYVTISTGINSGFVHQQKIVPELADSEAGQMLLEHHGKRMAWEDFASGRAIVERFGKKAADITDQKTWQRIAHDLAIGFIEMMAIMQPDTIIVGGSVGNYFDRFKDFLVMEVAAYDNPMITRPVFQQAARPEEAVIYGCYDLAHERYA